MRARKPSSHIQNSHTGNATMTIRLRLGLVSLLAATALAGCGKKEEAPPAMRPPEARLPLQRRVPRKRSSTSTTGRTTSNRRCSRSSPRRPASRSTTTSSTRTKCSRRSCWPATPATTSSCRPPTFLERQIKAGVFRSSIASKLPNWSNLDPEILQRVAAARPGQRALRQPHVGHDGIGYNEGKVKAIMPDAPIDSWRPGVRSEDRGQIQGLRHLGARRADRHGRRSCSLPRQGSQQPVRRGSEARRGHADGDPPVHPHDPQLAIHRRARERRDLHRGRLERRRAAGARPGGRGRQGTSSSTRSRRKARSSGSTSTRSRRTRPPGQCTRVHRLHGAARRSRRPIPTSSTTRTAMPRRCSRRRGGQNDTSIYPTAEVKAKLFPDLAETGSSRAC